MIDQIEGTIPYACRMTKNMDSTFFFFIIKKNKNGLCMKFQHLKEIREINLKNM